MKEENKDEKSLRVKILLERHKELDDQVDLMSNQQRLLEHDYQKLKVLKVKRLRCKDAIEEIRNEEA